MISTKRIARRRILAAAIASAVLLSVGSPGRDATASGPPPVFPPAIDGRDCSAKHGLFVRTGWTNLKSGYRWFIRTRVRVKKTVNKDGQATKKVYTFTAKRLTSKIVLCKAYWQQSNKMTGGMSKAQHVFPNLTASRVRGTVVAPWESQHPERQLLPSLFVVRAKLKPGYVLDTKTQKIHRR